MHGLQSLIYLLNMCVWTSVVAQWTRIHLPRQGTWVEYLVQEDSTCHTAAKPVCHNYWALVAITKARAPGARALQQETPLLVQLEKACAQQWRPSATKNKIIIKKKKKNPSCNAGDTGPIPDQGNKIPRVVGQLNLCTATSEPTNSEAEAPQLKSPWATTKTRYSQINTHFKKQ